MKRVLQVFRDGHESSSYLNFPLLDGEQGNAQTLEVMKTIVLEDRLQPDLRRFVLRTIVGDVAGHDSIGEMDRIFQFAQHRIVYRQDPVSVERVADIWSTLYALNPNEPEGDCGIKSVFVASCAAMLGHKPFFAVVKQRANQRAYNHVFNAVVIDGELRYYDATPQDKPAGWVVPHTEMGLFPIFD